MPKQTGNRVHGVTMLELVVAMVISLLVMGGVFKIYHANSLTYRTQEALARLQENGRLALDLLSRDIRMAGYYGCVSVLPSVRNNLNSASSFRYDFTKPIQGNEWNGTGWLPALDPFMTVPLKGSDAITIRTSGGDSVSVREQMAVQSSAIGIDHAVPPRFKKEDIVLISDCQGASIFQVIDLQTLSGVDQIVHSAGPGVPGNCQEDLDHRYGIDAQIMKMDTVAYYLRNDGDVPTLYRKNLTTTDGIVPGVENMQVLYGVGNLYLRANEITDWNDVTSVRVGLLLRTVEEIGGGEMDVSTYQVCDKTIDPADDRRLRRVMTTTIAVRNRLK
jgi:type IV pilus assembly protein PilW